MRIKLFRKSVSTVTLEINFLSSYKCCVGDVTGHKLRDYVKMTDFATRHKHDLQGGKDLIFTIAICAAL
jgi:hypothetical protein